MKMLIVMVLASFAVQATSYDMGPTYGEDRVGGDYKHIPMHSAPSAAHDHYRSTAVKCAALCVADAKCCEYTYSPPSADTCILKATASSPSRRKPPSGDTTRWTGLARRAVTNMTNATYSAQCGGGGHSPAPSPKPHPHPGPPTPPTPPVPCSWPSSCKGLWDNVHCVCLGNTSRPWPFPGPDYQHPKIHNSPDCLHNPGWHDMAGAISVNGVHHIFQGCPDGPGSDAWNNHPNNHDTAGWHHATSTDFVHYTNLGIPPGLAAMNETYKGMRSFETPCSGFVTIDPDTTQACAGFRQCHGTGVVGASKDGVPLELRCTPVGDDSLQNWSKPEFIDSINPNLGHHEPYDPPRPWVDQDGQWYLTISVDACNNSNPLCPAGGRLAMWTSPALRGSKAAWKQIGPLFTANMTKSGMKAMPGAVTGVFVTTDYIGGLRGDPSHGATRCVIQNAGGRTYWCGNNQKNGNSLEPLWDQVGAVGQYDYGALTMARTISTEANQVLPSNSRIVMVGWTGSPIDNIGAASQSLARDLTMSDSHELLQQFVPELQGLRIAGSEQHATLHSGTMSVLDQPQSHVAMQKLKGALRLEIVATFSWTSATMPTRPFGYSWLSGAGNLTVDCTSQIINNTGEAPGGCMVGIVTSTAANNNTGVTMTPMPVLPVGCSSISIHSIFDHSIVETIVNNRTAMVTYSINTNSASETDVEMFGAKPACPA